MGWWVVRCCAPVGEVGQCSICVTNLKGVSSFLKKKNRSQNKKKERKRSEQEFTKKKKKNLLPNLKKISIIFNKKKFEIKILIKTKNSIFSRFKKRNFTRNLCNLEPHVKKHPPQ